MLGLDKCILFLQMGGGPGGVGVLLGLTAGDGCPKSQQCSDVRQRWSKICSGLNKRGSQGG